MSGKDKHRKILDLLGKVAIGVDGVNTSRHAAALVYKNDIVAIGVNQKKTHPFQKRYQKRADCTWLHSEIDAIKKALRTVKVDDLGKYTLYVARVRKDMSWGDSKPCSGCMKAIIDFNIRSVFYTCEGDYYESL